MLAVLWYLSGFSVKAMLASKCVSKCFPPVFLVVPSSPPQEFEDWFLQKLGPALAGLAQLVAAVILYRRGQVSFPARAHTHVVRACVVCVRTHACACVYAHMRMRAHACVRALDPSWHVFISVSLSPPPSSFFSLLPSSSLFPLFPSLPLKPKKKKKKGPEFLFVAEVFAY